MKLRCGMSEYLQQKELKTLMEKMANLRPYKSYVFDNIFSSDKEEDDWIDAFDDLNTFKASLLYIFSNRNSIYLDYYERIPDIFYELTNQQQTNFFSYYAALQDVAINNGFLLEYNIVLSLIQPRMIRILKKFDYIINLISLIIIWYFTQSLLIVLLIYSLFSVLFRIEKDLNSNDDIKQQNDLIISIFDKKNIKQTTEWAKKYLIDIGWLNKEAKIATKDTD